MTADKKLWRNRKERKEWARRLQSEDPGLEVVHPHAAGIDVGNSAHYVAVRPERDPQPVRRVECFTADLRRLADWLQSCGVKTVAMQSTGVYWIPLYEILEERGFEVYLVNARHTRNLPGRKSDVQESQWLLKLHTYGLLNNSFKPPAEIRALRTYWRQRGEHVAGAATCIQRIQKALTQMNLQLANVISDISGLTGQAIVRAIVTGERDPRKLAAFRDPRIQASEEERLPRVWRATGVPNCCLSCSRNWRCTTPTSGGSPSATCNYRSSSPVWRITFRRGRRKWSPTGKRERGQNRPRMRPDSISAASCSASPEWT